MKISFVITYLFLIICFANKNAIAQTTYSKSSVIAISPSKIEKVNGVMIHFFGNEFIYDTLFTQKINGLELNLNPVGLFSPMMFLVHSIDSELHTPIFKTIEELRDLDYEKFKKINGVNVGLLNLEPSVINGLDINGTGSFETKVNGVTCSLLMNKHYVMNGLTIALLGNHDMECKGVQVGLFNSSKKLRGFQFGLWNKNEKRSLPFINWNFRKK